MRSANPLRFGLPLRSSGDIAAPAEQGLHEAALAPLGHRALQVRLHLGMPLEEAVEELLGLLRRDGETPGQPEAVTP